MADIIDIRHFSGATGMNLDGDERLLKDNEYRDAYNVRVVGSEGENVGSIENVLGNAMVRNFSHPTFTTPDGYNKRIGSCKNEENNVIYYFVHNSLGNHCIYRYNVTTFVIDHILYKEPLLDFSVSNKITHANVIGGLLFWVDGTSPKMLNIEKAFNLTYGTGTSNLDRYNAITDQILSVLKYPHISPPTASYVSDETYEQNNLRGKLFQFRIRYTYDNNEESVWSSISDLTKPEFEVFTIDGFWENPYFNNRIDVIFNTGSDEVYNIDIAARVGNTGHWRIIHTFNRYNTDGSFQFDSRGDVNYKLISNVNRVYWFYNNVIGKVIDQEDAGRDYDLVPIKTSCQDVIEKNRLIYADNTEGFDNVQINVSMNNESEKVSFKIRIELELEGLSFLEGAYWLKFTVPAVILPHRVYSLSLVYTNVSIPLNPNGMRVIFYKAKENDTQAILVDLFISELNLLIDDFPFFESEFATLDANGLTGTSDGVFYICAYALPLNWVIPLEDDDYFRIMELQYNFQTFKAGAWHEFGLRYYDEQGRGGAVNTSKSCNVYVPNYTQSNGLTEINHRNLIEWHIYHNPPSWAKYYKWCYTKNTSMVWSKYRVLDQSCFIDEGTYYRIIINKILESDKLYIPVDKREYYTDWQYGDKIRFLAEYDSVNSNKWLTYKNLIEYEILNAELDDVADPNIYYIKVDKFPISLIVSDIDDFQIIVDVYRPRKDLPDKENDRIFYEIGELFEIEDGIHKVPNGTIANGNALIYGDTYLRTTWSETTKLTYSLESNSYSDYYDSEFCDIGRPVIVDNNAKRQRYKADMRYGGIYVQNTQINDLCKFLAADLEQLNEMFGAITKIKEIGYTLVVLQKHKVNSIFIGREGLNQASYAGLNIVVGVSEVLSNWSPSEDRWGCQNPESVFTDGRRLYFADVNNGVIIRKATNGMVAISDAGVKDYFRDLFRELNEGIGGYIPLVYGYYDGRYDEVGFTVVSENPDEYNVRHYGSLVFKEEPVNRWISFRDYYGVIDNGYGVGPDGFDFMGQYLVSWYYGDIWVHNASYLRNVFYNIQHNLSLSLISNKESIQTKVFTSIGYTSNVKLTVADQEVCELTIKASENYPLGMFSKIFQDHFTEDEDEFWAPILQDMYTNADTSAPVASLPDLFTGRSMRGKSIKVNIVSDRTDDVVLFTVIIKSRVSR